MSIEQPDTIYTQNRELSWLKFNERVLYEANRVETPLLERLRYISIFTSNLDEFYMIRVGTLTDYALFNVSYKDNKTGMNSQEQLDAIFRATTPLYELREQAYKPVMEGLKRHGVMLLKMNEISGDDIKALKKSFTYNILPLLSPQIIDSRHPFPHLVNKQHYVAVTLEGKKRVFYGLIATPPDMDRMVLIGEGCRFVLLEDLIMHFSDMVFTTYKVLEKNVIAVTRNADINTDDHLDEDIDFRLHMKDLLKKRRRLSPVRLELACPASRELLGFLCDKLSLTSAQVFYSTVPMDLSFCASLNRIIDKETLKRLIWPPFIPAEIVAPDKKANMLRLVQGKDLLISYPFESMSPFLAMIRQAVEDASVISIKIVLYRIDVQSRLAEMLIMAAENGKEVIVLMELRARFDENNNIEWAQRLEEAGCRIIYGFVGHKVHSKVCLITRKESGKIHYTTQFGTGNYNENTAKQYTDLSLTTTNQELGREAASFFSNLLLGNLDGEYNRLWVAPGSYKTNVLRHIEEERQKALSGGHGCIIIKCNSLTDKDVIEKLVDASRDGVVVSMIIRGICCLLPQIPGATENIRVISIVGRFLEHTRIYCFGAGPMAKVYISSADLMTRNTERRVEVACPILDAELKDRVQWMLATMLDDNTRAWELHSDGGYMQRSPPDKDSTVNSQELFTQQSRVKVEMGMAGVAAEGASRSMMKRALGAIKKFFLE